MGKTRLLFCTTMLFCLMTGQSQAQVAGAIAAAVPSASGSIKVEGEQWPELVRGAGNYRQGNYEEALDDLTKVRQQHPESAVAAYYLGATLKRMQQVDNAVPNLKDAVTLQPSVKQAFLELADAYYTIGKQDEALLALEVCEREGIEPGQTAFLKGVILISKRKYEAAKASFESAKAADPSQTAAADYQVASLYARQGKNTEAIASFTKLANAYPDSDIGDMARQQAEELAKRKDIRKYHASAGIQYQYDTNVILQPASVPTSSISDKADSAAVLTAQADYALDLSGPYGLKFQYGLYASAYAKLKTYDVQSHTLGFSSAYRLGENAIVLDLYGNYTLVDQKNYLEAVSLSPGYTFSAGEDKVAKVYARFEKKKYLIDLLDSLKDEDRSGNETAGGISWISYIEDQQGYLSFKYELNKDKTDGKNWSYLGNKLSAATLYPVSENWKTGLSLEAFSQKFDNARDNPTTTAKDIMDRKDTTYTAAVQAVYAITSSIDAQIQVQYVKNKSTMDLYTYEKQVLGISLNARF